MDRPLLKIDGLSVRLLTVYGTVRGVRRVDLEVGAGEIVGIVGESGCGKTLTAKSVLRLLNKERARVSGEITFDSKSMGSVNLLNLGEQELRKLRGSEISMVLQDSSLAFSPIIPIGKQMTDIIMAHKDVSKKEAREIAESLLEEVGISEPDMRLKCLPGELSGGQLQRICIATAISSEPRLLIADEPTTALDSVSQAQILKLLKRLSVEHGMAVLIVTHNFSVIKSICDRVYVMYAGFVVESGSVTEVMTDPRHCYTRDLLRAIPKMGSKERLKSVPGSLPDVYQDIEGCAYRPRCDCAGSCKMSVPPRPTVGHFAACDSGGDET